MGYPAPMPARTLSRDGFSLLLRDDAWQESTRPTAPQVLLLEKQTRTTMATLILARADDPEALRARWTATPPQLALPVSDSQTLRPAGPLSRSRSLDQVLLWTELRDGEDFLIEEGDLIRFFSGHLYRPGTPGPDLQISATLACNLLIPLEKLAPAVQEMQALLRGATLRRSDPVPVPAPAPAPSSKLTAALSGARLWLGDSHSSGRSAGGGGYTHEVELHLGTDGRFRYRRTTITSIPGFSGAGGVQNLAYEGRWSIEGERGLRLVAEDGTVRSLGVRLAPGCVYLDGERYLFA